MKKQVIIENPVINSPFTEPERHFKFTDESITNKIIKTRRDSIYFVPIAKSKGKSKQKELAFNGWTQERIKENELVNDIRKRVGKWRSEGYRGVTSVTRQLLEYWTNPDREKKFFFCQIEAIETLIYITEVAKRHAEHDTERRLKEANEESNPGLFRIATKMATGTGKTVVMAMTITWHTLNKIATRNDARFGDTFLVVTPGITIRDRLRVLLPTNENETDCYTERDIIPNHLRTQIGKAKIEIINYHKFIKKSKVKLGKATEAILESDKHNAFTETPDQMVRRVCRSFGNKKNIIVLNDEAHHCYRKKPNGKQTKLKGDERREAQQRDQNAKIWLSGIEAIKRKIGIRAIYDLSATPFFLRGSGWGEGKIFPWTVSDFSLIDAIESGIVKVPRVPIDDNQKTGETPTYRELWLQIRDKLPKSGRKKSQLEGEPKLPVELEGAIESLYGNYEKYFQKWKSNQEKVPVMIIVCNNTSVSKLVYDYISGWTKKLENGDEIVVPGKLPLFNNEENSQWKAHPNTILVDSQQLESGEAMTPAFKKAIAPALEQFKTQYQKRFPGRSAEKLNDSELLREVMNSVGKKGGLGEKIRCVVSVSMLTEGWDCSTVTHILGVRAFGTQLLCEQVVGRGLRRTNHTSQKQSIEVAPGEFVDVESFSPEYAEIYGIPFEYIPCSGTSEPKPGNPPTRVRALDDRINCEITFPRLIGYRYRIDAEELRAQFSEDSKLIVSPEDVPTRTEIASIIGEANVHYLSEGLSDRPQQIEFRLAEVLLKNYFTKKEWLFPQLLAIVRRWINECVHFKKEAFPQMLGMNFYKENAVEKIYQSIVKADPGAKKLMPILQPYEQLGSTRYVDFYTTQAVYPTHKEKCHVSHVVADTKSWEQKMAQNLELDPEVVSYVKNEALGFFIPYTIDGRQRNYFPDFIAKIDNGKDKPFNRIIEVTGKPDRKKGIKVAAARNLWTVAVNNHGEFGRWEFLEVSDPWDWDR